MKSSDGNRPRSLIILPWSTAAVFEDLAGLKRPRSLPPLDTNFDLLQLAILQNASSIDDCAEVEIGPYDTPTVAKADARELVSDVIVTDQRVHHERAMIDESQLRRQTVTSEVVKGAMRRGQAITLTIPEHPHEGEVEDNEIRFAKSTRHAYPVSPKEIQCITVSGRLKEEAERSHKRGIKRKFPIRVPPINNGHEIREIRASLSGPLPIVVENPFVEEKPVRRGSVPNTSPYSRPREFTGENPIRRGSVPHTSARDFREAIDSAMDCSDDEAVGKEGNKVNSRKGSFSRPTVPPPRTSPYGKHYSPSDSNWQNGRRPSLPFSENEQTGKLKVRTTPPGTPPQAIPGPRKGLGHRSSPSTSSQKLKSFITWPSEGGKQSDDAASIRSEKYSRRIGSMDDKERSFEELIQSGGTIHCTITPDPIRDIKVSWFHV